MKILVTGHSGMLGSEVCKAVERMGHTILTHANWGIDITEMPAERTDASIVINCAGLVPQRDPPPSAARMMRVNGYGPLHLAEWCERVGARLIQVSTDCVFDGSGSGPHSEGDYAWPISNYGKSKLAGEIRREPHLTVRTSFVGFGKRGLIAELMQHEKDAEPYKASSHLLWTGHTTRFVAEALVMLAEKEIHGLLHIPGETLTRYELCVLLRDTLDRDFRLPSTVYEPKIDRRLASTRWAKEGLPDLPSFEWQLEWLRRSQ